jgi:hypothetical protein
MLAPWVSHIIMARFISQQSLHGHDTWLWATALFIRKSNLLD